MKKAIFPVILACAMLVSTGLCISPAEDRTVISGTFSFMKTFSEEVAQETYYYSDDYFSAPSEEENPHLTTMSLALAVSTFEEGGARFVTELLTEIGFRDIETTDMEEEPTPETIGTAIAWKETGYGPVVAVAIRGGKYRAEWASSLAVGTDGDAAGFAQAAEKVSTRIRDYIGRHGLDRVRIWIAGYSRSGAVADLTAVFICEHPEGFRTSPEYLYAYIFEAPGASGSDRIYGSIHSIRNRNDIIPGLLSEKWGLYINGTETIIGGSKSVRTMTFDILGMSLSEDGGETEMAAAVKQITDFLAEKMPRARYADEAENAVCALLSVWFSKSETEREQIGAFISSGFIEKVKGDPKLLGRLAMDATSALMLGTDDAYRKLSDDLWEAAETGLDGADLPLTDEEMLCIRNSLYPVLRTFGPILAADYQEGLGIHFATLAGHIQEIIHEHYPEYVIRLVQASDSYYHDGE